jgi:hypothetical protein
MECLTTENQDGSLQSDETQVSNPEEGRLMYYEHQLQRSEYYEGWLNEGEIPEDEMRALFSELADYFGVCSYWSFRLPCRGLPGLLHEKYDRDEEAATLLRLGIEYVGAIISNERKTMHNRWKAAREMIRDIEERGIEQAIHEHIQEQVRYDQNREETAQQQRVYFIGSQSGPIKIGIAVRPMERLKTLQTGHHEKLELLATCDGGQRQEAAYHKQFKKRRLNGEWFERCPEIEAEIDRLTNPREVAGDLTELG